MFSDSDYQQAQIDAVGDILALLIRTLDKRGILSAQEFLTIVTKFEEDTTTHREDDESEEEFLAAQAGFQLIRSVLVKIVEQP